MKAKNTLAVFIILAALGAYVLMFERGKAPEPGQAGAFSRVVGFDTDHVWKLEVNRETDPLWLIKEKKPQGDLWKLAKPFEAPADADLSKSTISDLADASVEATFPAKTSELGQYGLDKPAWEFTISSDDGSKRIVEVGGKDPAGTKVYLKVKDRPDVMVISSYTLDALHDKKAEDLRDKTVTAFDKDKVEKFELASKGQTIRVERDGDGWKITSPVKEKARKEKVDSILQSFESLKGSKVVEDNAKDLNKYGLASPIATASFWIRGEKEPRVALIGNREKGATPPKGASANMGPTGDIYAKNNVTRSVYTIPSYSNALTDAQTKLEDLKELPPPPKGGNTPAAPNGTLTVPPANTPPPPAPPAKTESKVPTIDKPIKPAPAKPAPKKP